MDDFLDPSVPTQLQEDFFQALRDLGTDRDRHCAPANIWERCRARSGVRILPNWHSHIEYIGTLQNPYDATPPPEKVVIHWTILLLQITPPCAVAPRHARASDSVAICSYDARRTTCEKKPPHRCRPFLLSGWFPKHTRRTMRNTASLCTFWKAPFICERWFPKRNRCECEAQRQCALFKSPLSSEATWESLHSTYCDVWVMWRKAFVQGSFLHCGKVPLD